MPLTSQSTLVEPMRSLMDEAIALDRAPLVAVGLTAGFPASDVPECGPAVYACGHELASHARSRAYARRARAQPGERVRARDLHRSIERSTSSRATTPERGRPVILVDTQDNPGAGGNADTMTLIRGADRCADRARARRRHLGSAGGGSRPRGRAGATVDLEPGVALRLCPATRPCCAEYRVEALGDGRFIGTGPFYLGSRFELGPMALLRMRRRAHRGREPQAAGCRPGDVPAPRRGAGRSRGAAAQELGALPRGFRRDGQPRVVVEAPGSERGGPGATAVSQAASGRTACARRAPGNAIQLHAAAQLHGPMRVLLPRHAVTDEHRSRQRQDTEHGCR